MFKIAICQYSAYVNKEFFIGNRLITIRKPKNKDTLFSENHSGFDLTHSLTLTQKEQFFKELYKFMESNNEYGKFK